MKNLNFINAIEEIDRIYNYYSNSDIEEARKVYEDYIIHVISVVRNSYLELRLSDYWKKLKGTVQ